MLTVEKMFVAAMVKIGQDVISCQQPARQHEEREYL